MSDARLRWPMSGGDRVRVRTLRSVDVRTFQRTVLNASIRVVQGSTLMVHGIAESEVRRDPAGDPALCKARQRGPYRPAPGRGDCHGARGAAAGTGWPIPVASVGGRLIGCAGMEDERVKRFREVVQWSVANIDELERQSPAVLAEFEREAEAAVRPNEAERLRAEAKVLQEWIRVARSMAEELRERGLRF